MSDGMSKARWEEIRDCVALLGPPKPGQVLLVDGRCVGNWMEFTNGWPSEWTGTIVRVVTPNAPYQKVTDVVCLVEVKKHE